MNGPILAVVRSRNSHTSVTDSMFWAILFLGIAGSAICVALAWLAAAIYDEPMLFGLISLQGLTCLSAALAGIPSAILIRKMRTRLLATLTGIAKLSTFAVTAILAVARLDAWAIVIGSVAGTFVWVLVLWAFQPRWPKVQYHAEDAWPSIRLGWLIGVEGLLGTLTVRSTLLIFGHFHGIAALGQLNFALRLVDEIGFVLSTTLSRTAFPLFSAIHRRGEILAAGYLRALEPLAAVLAPVLLGLASVSHDLIPIVFGEKWRPAVPAIWVLCFVWTARTSVMLASSAMTAIGDQRPSIIAGAVTVILSIGTLVLTANFGPIVGLSVFVTPLIFVVPFYLRACSINLGTSIRSQLSTLATPILSALAMAATVAFARLSIFPSIDARAAIAIDVPAGVAIYAAILLTIDRPLILRAISLIKGSPIVIR